MFRIFKSIVAVFVFALCVSFTAVAQETTGSVEGTITDAAGAVVPGVEVTVTSRLRKEGGGSDTGVGFRRSATTDSNGFFRLQQVPPGFYTVATAATSGFGISTAPNVEVVLGRATPVNIGLTAGSQSVTVDVNADTLAIDPTGNQIQTNITQRTAELLPKGTNFTSLLTVAPAVRNEPLSGGFQIDGASGSENTFIIDGQEVSNFRTGTLNLNNNIPFQIVQEVQVKSSGFTAEFGGATGGVISVATRGGGNEFRGEFGTDLRISRFQGTPRPFLTTLGGPVEFFPVAKDEGTDFFPFASLGGPIIKNRIWFFGSYAPQFRNIDRTINLFGADRAPGTRTIASTNTYTLRQKNEYAFGRIDIQPTQKIRLSGTYLWNPIDVLGNPPGQNSFGSVPAITFPGRGLVSGPEFANFQGGRQSSNNTNGSVTFTPTDRLIVTARGGYSFLNEKLGNYGVPAVAGVLRVVNQDTRNADNNNATPANFGQARGTQSFPGFSQLLFDVSRRRTFDADASYLLSNFVGRHQFKGGVQFNGISNSINSTFVDTVVFRFGADQTIQGRTGRTDAPPPTPGAIGVGFFQRFGAFGSAGSDNLAFYIQDSWQPFNRLTLNLGVRTERENSPSFNALGDGITFDFADKIAPRLGFALDLFGDGRTKLFGSYGRFFDRFKYELPRGSFGGNFFRVDYFEIFPGQTVANFNRQTVIGSRADPIGGQCPITQAGVLTRCQLDFRIPSNLPGMPDFGQVDPDIEAFRQSEYTIGLERAIGKDFLIRSRYTHKQVDVAVEDIGIPTAGGEAYVIGNPGRGLAKQIGDANGFSSLEAVRDYDAFEIGLDKRFVNNFYFNANYTFSRLFGNYAGLASSDEGGRTSPNVNRNFDLPFIGFSGLGQPDNGRLPTDRPHVFKFYGAYEIPFNAVNSLEISGFQNISSGSPVTTRYTVFGVAGQILNGRGDLGRTEKFTQTDLGIRHRYRFGADRRFSLMATLDILNLFDEENVLARSEDISTTGVERSALGIPIGTSSIQQEALYQRQAFAQAALTFIQTGRFVTPNRSLTNADGTRRLADPFNACGAPDNPSVTCNLTSPTYNLPNLFQGARNVRFGFRLQF